MSGWSYGKFCHGCPNEIFCDWYCIADWDGCYNCEGRKYCVGKCNIQVSILKRYIRNLKFYINQFLYKFRR